MRKRETPKHTHKQIHREMNMEGGVRYVLGLAGLILDWKVSGAIKILHEGGMLTPYLLINNIWINISAIYNTFS